MDFFALGTAIIAAVALGIAATATAGAAVFRARMLIPREVPDVPVTLVLAATGPLPGLEMLFDALLGQTLRPARLIVAVESRDDPAHDRVEALAQGYPALPIELIVAGLSGERAQKCTNLLAALARLRPADSYIVLIDADIRPQPWWLAALVAPLAAGRADIVNGYRWQAPQSVSLATAIGATIDRAIATQPRLDRFRLLWGGSLALTRGALELIDAPASLAHALTEDLVIADRAAALGLRVLTRRGLRVPPPLSDRACLSACGMVVRSRGNRSGRRGAGEPSDGGIDTRADCPRCAHRPRRAGHANHRIAASDRAPARRRRPARICPGPAPARMDDAAARGVSRQPGVGGCGAVSGGLGACPLHHPPWPGRRGVALAGAAGSARFAGNQQKLERVSLCRQSAQRIAHPPGKPAPDQGAVPSPAVTEKPVAGDLGSQVPHPVDQAEMDARRQRFHRFDAQPK